MSEGYASLCRDFEDFYTRWLYHRIQDLQAMEEDLCSLKGNLERSIHIQESKMIMLQFQRARRLFRMILFMLLMVIGQMQIRVKTDNILRQ